jgi:MSHA pilin protein MshD
MKTQTSPRHRRAGFSLIEVTMATLVTGILLSGSLAAFAQLHGRQKNMAIMEFADLIEHDLMQEIISFPYSEPSVTTVSTGPDAGETSRSLYDDIDDYHGWTESFATTRTGSAIPAGGRFRRSVTVEFVRTSNMAIPSLTNQGARVITIVVSLDGQPISSLQAYRTQTDNQVP